MIDRNGIQHGRRRSQRLRLTACVISSLLALCTFSGCQRTTDSPASSLSAGRNPPRIIAVQLLPNPPTLAGPLTVAIDASDPERAPLSFRYQWFVNDAPLAGATDSRLDPALVKRGDHIALEVVASNGRSESAPFRLAPVVIVNSAPIVSFAVVEPEYVPLGEPLKAKSEVRDADGDEVTLTYRWKRNGQFYKEGSEDALDTAGLQPGDLLQVEVLARDRETEAKPVLSKPSVVSHGGPRITSQPRTDIVAGRYEYHVQATDAEGESLTYQLEAAPSGMQIDNRTGQILWQSTSEQVGRHLVRVVVKNQKGVSSFQEFELTLSAPARNSQGT